MRDPYITDGTTREFASTQAPPPRRGLRPPNDPWVVVALIASGTALIIAVAGLAVAGRMGRPGPGPVSAAVWYANRRLRSPGFWTRCSGRPGTMRQRYAFERSSWSGFRSYTGDQWSPWTAAQSRSGGALSVPCPAGRTGTYDYRLSVILEISGKPVGPAAALSNDKYRGGCGTGVS